MELVNQLLIMLPITVLLFYGLLYLLTNDSKWIVLILLSLVLGLVNEHVFKKIIGQERPSMRGGKYGCHTYSYAKNNDSLGMPSGHAVLLSLFLVAMIDELKSDQVMEKAIVIALCTIAILHRVHLGCHTSSQIVVGSIIGISSYHLFPQSILHRR